MRLRLPSTLTLLALGPFMQLAAATEAWPALSLGGLVLAASCFDRPAPLLSEPEPEILLSTVPTGRPRPKFRGYAPWTPQTHARTGVSSGWGRVEDWFQ